MYRPILSGTRGAHPPCTCDKSMTLPWILVDRCAWQSLLSADHAHHSSCGWVEGTKIVVYCGDLWWWFIVVVKEQKYFVSSQPSQLTSIPPTMVPIIILYWLTWNIISTKSTDINNHYLRWLSGWIDHRLSMVVNHQLIMTTMIGQVNVRGG